MKIFSNNNRLGSSRRRWDIWHSESNTRWHGYFWLLVQRRAIFHWKNTTQDVSKPTSASSWIQQVEEVKTFIISIPHGILFTSNENNVQKAGRLDYPKSITWFTPLEICELFKTIATNRSRRRENEIYWVYLTDIKVKSLAFEIRILIR